MRKDIDTRGFYYIEQNRYYRDYITLCEIYFKFLYFDWKRQPEQRKFCTVILGMISEKTWVNLAAFDANCLFEFFLFAILCLFRPITTISGINVVI